MTSSFVRFDGVWKRFRRGEVHDSLRDLIPALTRRAVRRGPGNGLRENEFWALQDVSFDVQPGEALGIIGGNGAGKSTVLKILTKILRPNRGSSSVNGRIGALIEVAAGFHGDLTGRENVFLQGSIMGMPLAHIRRKFDEIVEFSGIEDFIDTPVKRYSSGMYARLGFAIAAHLDPDVLIIDEILAVGDFRFQNRAFAKIKTLATSGIPVVLVSHQLDRVATLCTKALVLDHGRVVRAGGAGDCIGWYTAGGDRVEAAVPGTRSVLRLGGLEVLDSKEIGSGERVDLRLPVTVARPPEHEYIRLQVRSATTAEIIAGTDTTRFGVEFSGPGQFDLEIQLTMNVAPGVYALEPHVIDAFKHEEVAAGPIAYVHVRDEPGFIGHAQLHPSMVLRSSLPRA